MKNLKEHNAVLQNLPDSKATQKHLAMATSDICTAVGHILLCSAALKLQHSRNFIELFNESGTQIHSPILARV
jgi:hypothetical protein